MNLRYNGNPLLTDAARKPNAVASLPEIFLYVPFGSFAGSTYIWL